MTEEKLSLLLKNAVDNYDEHKDKLHLFLWEEFGEALYAIAVSKLGRSEGARDYVSNFFTEVVFKPSFTQHLYDVFFMKKSEEGGVGGLAAYLLKSGKNIFTKWIIRESRRSEVEEKAVEMHPQITWPEETDKSSTIEYVLKQIPDEQGRTIFSLWVCGLKPRMIAPVIDLAPAKISRKLHRTKLHLQAKLGHDMALRRELISLSQGSSFQSHGQFPYS